jgi:antitoxin HicB
MSIHKNYADHYRSLNYRIEIERDEEGDYIATVPLLPGCIADGATAEEAASRVEAAKEEWIAARIEADLPIPEPQTDFSGRWLLRTTPTLHRKVAECAQHEKVSINQFVNNVLAEAVGYRLVLAGLPTNNWKIFSQYAQEGHRVYVAFGNRMHGGVLWQHGLPPFGQNEPAVKPIDTSEPAELRA